jgi:SAM-dependent methyltransferase
MAETTDRRQFFDRLAPQRAREMRRHAAFYADRMWWLRRIIPADASVIDVGCGVGKIVESLPNVRKTGIDFSPAMIAEAMRRDPKGRYLVDDAEHLQHAETYDYVLLLDAVNYIRDVQESLKNIRKNLCTDRTRVVITMFNFLWAPAFRFVELLGLRKKFPAQNWLSYSDVENMLSLEGFEVVECGGRVLLPFRFPLLEPLFNRVFAVLPLLNRLCLIQTIVARAVPRETKQFSVSVLSAVRNERGNIRPIVDAMPLMGASTELIFVEGHSSDGTWEEIQRVLGEQKGPVTIRGYQQTGKGKGDALHMAIREAKGDILIVYDGDFTVHPSELPKLYEALASGNAEFVNGSRLVYPMQERAMPIFNLMGNKIFSLIFSWLFAQKIVDVLSPVKAFFATAYPGMTTRLDPFGDFDLFLGAARQHCRIRETPLRYLERTYGTTKLDPIKHGWMLLTLFWNGTRLLKW